MVADNIIELAAEAARKSRLVAFIMFPPGTCQRHGRRLAFFVDSEWVATDRHPAICKLPATVVLSNSGR
jgi:hypothetical protein